MFMIKPEFPAYPISVKELFTYWLDLSGPPSREFCGVIGHYMNNQELKEMGKRTEKGRAEYFKYCVRGHRSVTQVF